MQLSDRGEGRFFRVRNTSPYLWRVADVSGNNKRFLDTNEVAVTGVSSCPFSFLFVLFRFCTFGSADSEMANGPRRTFVLSAGRRGSPLFNLGPDSGVLIGARCSCWLRGGPRQPRDLPAGAQSGPGAAAWSLNIAQRHLAGILFMPRSSAGLART